MSHEKGEQSVITQPSWYPFFMHCYAHQFNLITETLELQNSQALVFSSLATIPTVFAKSPSRLAVLDSVSKRIPRESVTGWNVNNQVVNTVRESK